MQSVTSNQTCGDQSFTKSCGHRWECGCGKPSCAEIGLQDCTDDYYSGLCENENCRHYYDHRNDNCDCEDKGCPYCGEECIICDGCCESIERDSRDHDHMISDENGDMWFCEECYSNGHASETAHMNGLLLMGEDEDEDALDAIEKLHDSASIIQRAWRKYLLRTFRKNLDNKDEMSKDKTVMKWIREGNMIIEHDYFEALDEYPGQENVSDKQYYDAFLDRVEDSEEEVEETLLDELPLKVRMLLTHLYKVSFAEDNAQRCLKCDAVVPDDFWKKGWAECLHAGFFCPRHSPTCNCGDMECYCCNKVEP